MSFTIAAADATHTIFQCPKCNETIDATAETCRFCGVPVDKEAAMQAAAVLARVNQACSDASYMRTCAIALAVFFAARLVPFFNFFGLIGSIALSFVVPIWAIIWFRKFGKIASPDPDFRRARMTVEICGIIVGVVLLVLVLLPWTLALLHPAGITSSTQ